VGALALCGTGGGEAALHLKGFAFLAVSREGIIFNMRFQILVLKVHKFLGYVDWKHFWQFCRAGSLLLGLELSR
jgi:hypothetical protein